MPNTLSSLTIRPHGRENIRKHCGVSLDKDLAQRIGIHHTQVSRVLAGKSAPGNRFIASVIDTCGLKFAFDKVFQIETVEDES